MKEEQIKEIKKSLIAKVSHLDNNSIAAFLMGARVLTHAMFDNRIITYDDWAELNSMLGVETEKYIKLAKQ